MVTKVRVRARAFFEKNIVPQFEARGCIYKYRGANIFSFSNAQDLVRIDYDVSPPRGLDSVKVSIAVRYGVNWEHMDLMKLNYLSEPAKNVQYYDTREEFFDRVNLLTRQIILVLDHYEKIADGLITQDIRYYELMADNAQAQAKEFAKKHHLDFSYSLNNIMYLEELLKEKFPKCRASSRKATFEEDLSEIIPLCAYAGEIDRLRNGGRWDWGSYEKRGQEIKVYGAIWENKYGKIDGIDPLLWIITFLNFGPDLINPVLVRGMDLK